ncbi:MarR family winged helix-turn-helix transcriptional regulator [Sphingobium cloacae]|uniref:MarR family transcriptional regulator n=1 Tax=Sphingobium cloacae TaxID=120107 RepID=A0A1E1EY98_9SPHN|nr:MarR family winged helix-turn-helix transcriptional regulator [Sphingobium cloacae]BAV63230.1 MarR family transcriptional regulator [Sphingobium cloacae]
MTASANIATGLARIGMALRADAWSQAGTKNLSPTQAQILVHLVQRGPARVSAVAEALAVTQSTASEAVTTLVRKDHVERRSDPDDARATLLHATETGRRLAHELAVWPDALLGAIDALDPVEQAAFTRGLVKMIGALQERRAIPVQRMCVSCAHFRPHAHSDAARPHHCAFVDAAFGDAAVRLDCGEHVAADASVQLESWTRFKEAAA